MSKVICDVCGTSYPEDSNQCPVCGCVRPADAQCVAEEVSVEGEAAGYTQVKGGRYTKNNVRNRAAERARRNREANEKTDRILLITAAVLMLVIIVCVIYIAVALFTPNKPVDPTEPSESISASTPKDCTDLTLSTNAITFTNVGETATLNVTVTPIDTEDIVTYRSENVAVATVNEVGVITAVANGETKIIVTCGDIVKECTVTCNIVVKPDYSLSFNRTDFTMSFKGETWSLYDGSAPVGEVTWRSDDETVATIVNGTVTAVGGGVTRVYAEYEGLETVSCIVRCSFSNGGQQGSVGEDGKKTYAIHTVWGATTDFTIKVGESINLYMKDNEGNTVKAVWETSSNIVAFSNNTIVGVSSGRCQIFATFDGVTVKCWVSVN